jgi:uncharacterized membrane protein
MKSKARALTRGAIIAALYVVLTNAQNLLLPGSATWAIQMRVAECMCVLAFFTPSAIWGLSVGCFLFNILYAGALPLDWCVGTLATVLATAVMYTTRQVKLWGIPLLGLAMPALFNGLLVGWELSVYIGGAFWVNSLYVAAGEAIVLYTLGIALYFVMKKPYMRRILQ